MGCLAFHCYLVRCNKCNSIPIHQKDSGLRTQVQTAQRLHYCLDQPSLVGKSPKCIQAKKNCKICCTMAPEKVVGVPSTTAPACPPLSENQPRKQKRKIKTFQRYNPQKILGTQMQQSSAINKLLENHKHFIPSKRKTRIAVSSSNSGTKSTNFTFLQKFFHSLDRFAESCLTTPDRKKSNSSNFAIAIVRKTNPICSALLRVPKRSFKLKINTCKTQIKLQLGWNTVQLSTTSHTYAATALQLLSRRTVQISIKVGDSLNGASFSGFLGTLEHGDEESATHENDDDDSITAKRRVELL